MPSFRNIRENHACKMETLENYQYELLIFDANIGTNHAR